MPGVREAATPDARAVLAEEFRTGDGPEKLYQLDSSHNELADADPAAGGTTGYCVDVQNANIAPVGGANGFTAVDGTVESTDAYTGGTTPTQDDLYCAVVRPDALPSDELNGTMLLRWTYTDNPSEGTPTDTIELEIDVFRVELESLDGFVGGAAEICTNNWDPDILTGVASNLDGDFPDPTDEVQLGDDPNGGDATGIAHLDWHVTQGSPVVNLDKLGMFKDGNEWCMTLSADADTTGVTVELNFDAVYRRNTNVDDQSHAIETTLDFTTPDFSEVRHISPGGQIISSPVSPLNATGSRHTACIIPSKSTDTMAPSGVFIQPEGTASSIRTFHNDQGTMLPGVPDGTLCFSWTSHTVGDQTIQATFNYDDPDNGTEQRTAFWDTDGDGNGEPSLASAPLVKRWGAFERTEITRGGNPNANLVTDDSFDVGIAFNVADGTYSAGTISVTEWVIGRDGEDPPPDPRDVEDPGALPVPPLLDGVPLVAEITSQCGYFEADVLNAAGNAEVDQPQRITGVSVGGRFDLDPNPAVSNLGTTTVNGDEYSNDPDGLPDDIAMSINFDDDCTPRQSIELTITAYNPWEGIDEGDPIDTETLSIGFLTSSPESTPRVAWVGQQINTTFAFGGGCAPYDGAIITFNVSDDAPGSFIPSQSASLNGPKSISGKFTAEEEDGQGACSFTVGYESEDPGEVNITVSFSNVDDVLDPGRIDTTKVVFPIFYMALENIQLSATDDLPVSARGDATAQVRGWFPGNNPSGREAHTYENGNTVPADRWVLPDDWNRLRGRSDFRTSWPNTPSMPSTQVTFFMENEDVSNAYPGDPSDGAAGWFLMDSGSEFSLDTNPRTGESSALGSVFKPRIISDVTDSSGTVSVDTIGDLNLDYTDCPVNAPTGNPHCDIDDMVGSTTYYAVADYPEERNHGKWPPLRSNSSTTDWRWLGYKDVTVVDGAAPSVKYIVAQLQDRDGFCDGVFQHNTLGIEVGFTIDSGAGRITDVSGRPWTRHQGLQSATATTFDTHDSQGNPINTELWEFLAESDDDFSPSDDCLAWVEVSNSLLKPVNFLVDFPGQPAPVPGDVRITRLQCSANESFEVTNVGDNPVSLEGFSVRSRQDDVVNPEEHLDLRGYLEPGESAEFRGAPFIEEEGWLFSGNFIFDEIGDYARLVWNDFEIHRVECDGDEFVNNNLPDPLPADREGEILLDLIAYGDGDTVELSRGWNLVTVAGEGAPIGYALGTNADSVSAIYGFNPGDGTWDRFITGSPAFVNTLETFEAGEVYWVHTEQPFTLSW